MRVFIPDGDRVVDRIKCSRYDVNCNCASCDLDRQCSCGWRMSAGQKCRDCGDVMPINGPVERLDSVT